MLLSQSLAVSVVVERHGAENERDEGKKRIPPAIAHVVVDGQTADGQEAGHQAADGGIGSAGASGVLGEGVDEVCLGRNLCARTV